MKYVAPPNFSPIGIPTCSGSVSPFDPTACCYRIKKKKEVIEFLEVLKLLNFPTFLITNFYVSYPSPSIGCETKRPFWRHIW